MRENSAIFEIRLFKNTLSRLHQRYLKGRVLLYLETDRYWKNEAEGDFRIFFEGRSSYVGHPFIVDNFEMETPIL